MSKYQKWYDSITSNGQKRGTLKESKIKYGYIEKHHIIPKCMNGSDDISNITFLTAREHYLVHWLLCKIFKNTKYIFKLSCAFFMMCNSTTKLQTRNNSKYYDSARKVHSIEKSIEYKRRYNDKPKILKIDLRTKEEKEQERRSKISSTMQEIPRTARQLSNLNRSGMSEDARRKSNITRKQNIGIKVRYNEISFESLVDAAKFANVTPEAIKYRCKNKLKGWTFINE